LFASATFAPARNKRFASATSPLKTAHCSGVLPSGLRRLGSCFDAGLAGLSAVAVAEVEAFAEAGEADCAYTDRLKPAPTTIAATIKAA
jgi:hypothetical protein